jgi:hypothetical protein
MDDHGWGGFAAVSRLGLCACGQLQKAVAELILFSGHIMQLGHCFKRLVASLLPMLRRWGMQAWREASTLCFVSRLFNLPWFRADDAFGTAVIILGALGP